MNFRIVLSDKGKKYIVTNIVFYGDGGFGILAPYHSSHTGYLIKTIVDYKKFGNQKISIEESVQYTASDRVKLSIHPDGFVQFSGENPGKIISGRDPETGEPKGIGLLTQSLDRPIESGPTFGLTIWGIQEFKEFTKVKKNKEYIIFEEQNYFYQDCSFNDYNAYVIEGFVLTGEHWKEINDKHGKLYLTTNEFKYFGKSIPIKFRVIPFRNKKPDYFIMLLVSRIKSSFSSNESGYVIGSPSQLNPLLRPGKGVILYAMYPSPSFDSIKNALSLDYVAN